TVHIVGLHIDHTNIHLQSFLRNIQAKRRERALGMGQKLEAAGVKGAPLPNRRLRIATKYVNVARAYFASQGQQVDVIKLYGSMELAPLVGLGDLIVDVVDTGNTLRANGLEARDHICDVSSRLIVNQVSYKRKFALLEPILDSFKNSIASAS
ncbi:MAG: ATP phosphoribosyltransferase, partial [Psychrobacter sp.]|nr:ATP phosphoribosyltransferase [Psychrobacter sp.]